MTSLIEKRTPRLFLKNAIALHGVGKARFSSISSIHDSQDVHDMIAEMRRIVASTPSSNEEREVRLRVITFFHDHDIKE